MQTQTNNGINFDKLNIPEYSAVDTLFAGNVSFCNTIVGNLSFVNCNFANKVDFSQMHAYGKVCFIDCIFNEMATFSHGEYSIGFTAIGCIFKKIASFDWCKFYNNLRFWKSNFEDRATFYQSFVDVSNSWENNFIFNGEANFSYSYFASDVNFTRMSIGGPAYFWRTIFNGNVNFSETTFRNAAYFEGSSTDVCISKLELEDDILFKKLIKVEILKQDAEGGENLYAHFAGVTNWEQLSFKLSSANLSGKVDYIRNFWVKYNRSMFNEKRNNSFYLATFLLPDKVKFSNLSLRGVHVAELALQSVKFENITWHKSFFLFRRRLSIFNEISKVNQSSLPIDYKNLSQIYSCLKNNYTKMGLYEEARDFYCGELEMKRRSKTKLARLVDFNTYFKYLGGYGEYSEFALYELLVTIFLVFPLLYLLFTTDFRYFQGSVIHTLEIAAFLTSPEKNNLYLSDTTRIMDGILRILLAFELTMFLLPFKKQMDNRY